MILSLFLGTASAHGGGIYTIGPEVDWCNFINTQVEPGDLISYGGGPGSLDANLSWSPVQLTGAAVVTNNIFASGFAIDTDATGVSILGNTILGRFEVATAPADWQVVGNAIEGTVPVLGVNVSCSVPDDCWEAVSEGDFRPVRDSALLSGTAQTGLDTDYCGSNRYNPPAMGALERTETAAPLTVAFKSFRPVRSPMRNQRIPMTPGPPQAKSENRRRMAAAAHRAPSAPARYLGSSRSCCCFWVGGWSRLPGEEGGAGCGSRFWSEA